MKTLKLPLPAIKLDYQNCSLVEAKMRRVKGVLSCFMGKGYVKLTFADSYCASTRNNALLELSRLLGGIALENGKAIAKQSKDCFKGEKNADIDDDFKVHRRGAIISLGFFLLFEVMRRVSPATFLATSTLRSAAVLIMSKELLKNGVFGAIKERRPNADTLTMTAVMASVIAGKPESSLTRFQTVPRC